MEATAENATEALAELDSAISLLEEREPKGSISKGTVAIAETMSKDALSNLIRFDDDGPKILFRIEGNQIETQKQAFMTIAFVLNNFYNEKDTSSTRVSSLMEKSGLNTKNIHNATSALTGLHYIVKAKGQQMLTLTPQGEKFVSDLLSSEKKKLEGENEQ